MSLSTQPYKGARDFYPEDKRIQKYMFAVLRRVVEKYGYQEYDAPILEPLDLYTAKSGEEIVNEQTYQFEDRGGRQVVIRPEMTPTVSRMVAGKRQELAYPARWYSIPNLWRYERPQRGRLREHWQLNVDVFGIDNVSAELEMIQIADSILKEYGAVTDTYQIRLNSRKLVDSVLSGYFKLDKRVVRDLVKLIDRMNKLPADKFKQQLKDLVGTNAPQITKLLQISDITELPEELKELSSVKELVNVLDSLQKIGIDNAVFDISLMRGFDYYTDIVFEVFDTSPTNNRSMFGGGRFDGLVGLFGVEPIPTVGFGMGDVTLQNFLETNKLLPDIAPETDVAVCVIGDNYIRAQEVVSELRDSGVNVSVDSTGRKIDKQIKNADKQGLKYVIFIGDSELEQKKYGLKDLTTGTSQVLSVQQIIKALSK